MNRETVIDKYTVLRLKRATSENPPYLARGTLLHALRGPQWGENLEKSAHTHACHGLTLLGGRH